MEYILSIYIVFKVLKFMIRLFNGDSNCFLKKMNEKGNLQREWSSIAGLLSRWSLWPELSHLKPGIRSYSARPEDQKFKMYHFYSSHHSSFFHSSCLHLPSRTIKHSLFNTFKIVSFISCSIRRRAFQLPLGCGRNL